MLLAACHAGAPPPEPPAATPPGASAPAEVERRPSDAPSAAPLDTRPAPPVEPSEDSVPPRHVTSTCREPLAAFCRDNACPTFDAARAAAKSAARGYEPALCAGLCAGEVHVGDCGDLRYVQDGDCLCGSTLYFDAGGKIVGANRWGDFRGFCGHTSFTAVYGRVPTGCP
jgi:hypothetical protein